MKKLKGLRAAIEKFNSWPATARIYVDFNSNRIWTETFVNAHEGRFAKTKDSVCEIHNKEGLDTEGITIEESELLSLLEQAEEERKTKKFRRF